MSEFDPEEAAKQDIVARPEVTGSEKKPGKKGGKKAPENPLPAKEPAVVVSVDLDELDKATGRVIGKSFERIQEEVGVAPDTDLSLLLSEALGAAFSGIRSITKRPWLSLVFTLGGIGIYCIPLAMRYAAAKSAKEKKDENE